MVTERLAQLLRIGALALFSCVLASCGSGDGKSSVDAPQQETSSSKLQLVFSDYFGDPPATNSRGAKTSAKTVAKAPLGAGNWVIDTGYGEDGWGNDEWQLYTNSMENVFTENGNLVLRAQCLNAPACGQRDGSITSGKVISKDRINVKFGNISARIKMPSGGGMWPAFWTLGADIDERPWPDAGEIDIVEMHYYFSDNRTTHFSTHWAGPRYTDEADRPDCSANQGAISGDEEEICKTENKTFEAEDGFAPLTDDFHVYELDWNEDVIIGKIDGFIYFTQAIDGSTMEEFLKDHFLLLNVAVGGTLGGQQGPWMSADEWTDPDQSAKRDMLVDWVEVYERIPATSTTLIAESGANLRYAGILNSIDFGGGLVEVDEKTDDVPALVGSQTMSIRFSNTFSGEQGSRPVEFSGATFEFFGTDLSDFDHIVFSIDGSRFTDFDHIGVQFTDRNGDRWLLYTSEYMPTSVNGSWITYSIPLADFTGVDMNNVTLIGLFNPHDVDHNLLAGTLYFDDIRFTGSPGCSAEPSIEFDQINYNPDTTVAAVYVNDPCAANRQVLVKAENALGEIFVPAKLDAAGNGRAIINLGKSEAEECLANDTTAVLQLTPPLMASYDRPMAAKGDANSSFATAGVDPGAPITTITGDSDYILATSADVSFIPEQDFKFSDFGTGSSFNGNFTGDATFSPVFEISNVPNILAQMALFEFVPGFTRSTGTIDMKVKDLPGNNITVKFGDTLGSVSESTYTVNVATDPESTPLGDGWYLVSVPMANFANPDSYNYVVFASDNNLPDAVSFLITDIVLQERVGNLPAECGIPPVPPVTGSGTGATGATGGPFSISFDDMAVTYSFIGFGNPDTINTTTSDPVDAANTVVQTTKLAGAQVWAGVTVETIPGIIWPLSVAENEITLRIYSPGPGLTVRMKLEDSTNAANFIEVDAVTTVTTGWETLTFNFGTPPGYSVDKLSLFFGFGSVGDGAIYTWDTIEFLGTGGNDLPFSDDFESGDLDGWSTAPNGGTITADDTQAGGGTYSARLVAGPRQAPALSIEGLGIGSVSPGDTIDISWDMCGSFAGAGEVIFPALLSEPGGGAGGIRVFDTIASVPGVWTRYTRSFTADANPGNVDAGVSVQFDVVCGGDGGCAADVFFDNVNVTNGGGDPGSAASGLSCAGGGGGGSGAVSDYAYANNPAEMVDLVAAAIDGFGSGSTIIPDYALDPDYNRAYFVASGSGYCPTCNIAQLGFQGIGAGFAAAYDTFNFKIKATNLPTGEIQVALHGGGDPLHTYSITDLSVSTALGNDWYQMSIPMSDFTNIAGSTGFLFEYGNPPAPFDFLVTDIVFTTTVTDYAYANNPAEMVDLVAAAIDGFGSGSTITPDYALDPDYNRAYFVASGSGYCPTCNIAQLGFQGIGAGFAAAYDAFNFKIKATNLPTGEIQVALHGGGDPLHTYSVTDLSVSTALGNDWYQMSIPMSDFTNIAGSTGFLFEYGNPPASFDFLVTDIVFIDNGDIDSGTGGGGGGGELTINGDFEAGDISGWEDFSGANNGTFTATMAEASPTLGGSWSGNLVASVPGGGGPASFPVVKQPNVGVGTVTPNTAMTVSFDLKGSLTGGGGVIFVEFFSELSGGGTSAAGIISQPVPNSSWVNYNIPVTTGSDVSGGVTLQLKADCGANAGCIVDAYFDNVSITID